MNMPMPEGSDKERISLFQVGKLLTNELDSRERAALEARLDAEAPGYLERLRSERPARGWQALQSKAAAEGPGWRSRVERLKERVDRAFPRTWRPAFGFAALLLSALLVFTRTRPADPIEGFAAKGSGGEELRLLVNGRETEGTGAIPVRAGDTLAFLYRFPRPLFVGIWYRDGSGGPMRYSPKAEPWGASLSWAPAPGRIILGPGWRTETVFVLSSASAFTDREAENALAGGTGSGKIRIRSFPLRNQEP